MPNYARKVVYLTEAQRIELFANGSITVGSQTIDYSDNDIYVTPTTLQDVADAASGLLDVPVSGTSVTILAEANHRYNCGEVTSITITPPESGIFNVTFTSGSTAAVLTATGVAWPEWFDPEDLETDTVYELSVANGRGVVCTWAAE